MASLPEIEEMVRDRLDAFPPAEMPMFIGPIRFSVNPDVLSGDLQLCIHAFAYVAMIGSRLPTSIGVLSGTGLVTPTYP